MKRLSEAKKMKALVLLTWWAILANVSAFMHSFRPLHRIGTRLSMAAEFNWKNLKAASEEKMGKCYESTQGQFNTIRAGGANVGMLDRIWVDYAGTPTPLRDVARVSTAGASQLIVEPFDKSLLKEIEKCIVHSDLNLTPNVDSNGVMRVSIPALTEERRKDLVKQVKALCEDGKIAIRNVRRDFVDKVKAAEKDKTIGKDVSKDHQEDLQKLTDDFGKKLDNMLKSKEKELLKV